MNASLPEVQELMTNTAIMTAAATVLGAIVIFILVYMVLERKKKTLIFLFILGLSGYGIFYWSMAAKPIDQTGNPVPAAAPVDVHCHCAVPLPQPRPHLRPRPRPRMKKVPLHIPPHTRITVTPNDNPN